MQMNLKERERGKETTGGEVARRVGKEVRGLGVLEFEW
jgi:tetrahydromethanopterin S-methyltransferase subunit G